MLWFVLVRVGGVYSAARTRLRHTGSESVVSCCLNWFPYFVFDTGIFKLVWGTAGRTKICLWCIDFRLERKVSFKPESRSGVFA
jgi:hypothetical protein